MGFLSYIDYIFPREVMGPILLAFAAENIISIVFQTFIPAKLATIGWIVIFVFTLIAVTYWGEISDDENF